MASMATIFATSAAIKVRTTANLILRSQATAVAESGVQLAIAKLLTLSVVNEPADLQDFSKNIGFTCRMNDSFSVLIKVSDEAGKVNMSLAPPELIAALFEAFELNVHTAKILAGAVVDYRDPDDTDQFGKSENNGYKDFGLKHFPSNSPFLIVDELEQVKGMPLSLLKKVEPYITVSSERAGVDPKVWSHEWKKKLQQKSNVYEKFMKFSIQGGGRTFSILVKAANKGRVLYSLKSVVRLTVGRKNKFQILRQKSTLSLANEAVVGPAKEPCWPN